jgi:hypothetical protein
MLNPHTEIKKLYKNTPLEKDTKPSLRGMYLA